MTGLFGRLIRTLQAVFAALVTSLVTIRVILVKDIRAALVAPPTGHLQEPLAAGRDAAGSVGDVLELAQCTAVLPLAIRADGGAITVVILCALVPTKVFMSLNSTHDKRD